MDDPFSSDNALCVLERADRRQTRRRRLQSLVCEIASYCNHCRADGFIICSTTCEMSGDHIFWSWPPLHRHARRKRNYIQPIGTYASVGPVHKPYLILCKQDVVSAHVKVQQRIALEHINNSSLD